MAQCAAKPWRPTVPLLLVLTLACTLVGCESPEEIRQAYAQQCASNGFQPGTAPFAECLQRESSAARYRLNQSRATWGPPNAVPTYAVQGSR